MNLKMFLAAIARYRVSFIAVGALVLALGVSGIALTPAKYVSTAQLMVSISGASTATAYQNDEVVTGRVNSYIPLLTSDVVSQRVIDKLGLQLTAPELAATVSATNVPPKTSIINVAVTAASPEQAQLLADTYVKEFVSYVTALETPTGEDSQKVRVTLVDSASQPRSDRIQRVLLGCLAAMLALLSGAVAVWVRSLTDPLVRTAERAAETARAPVLGTVPSGHTVSAEELDNYRRLRTALKASPQGDDAHVLEIVPVDSQNNAAPIASNLRRVLQPTSKRCVVVDVSNAGDSVQESQPGPAAGPQIVDHDDAATKASEDAARPTGEPGGPELQTTVSMPEGAIEPDGISGGAATGLIDRLRAENDHLIIAAPPASSGVTASALSEYADAVALVVSADRTKRNDLRRAAEDFRSIGARVIGLIMVRENHQ